MKSSTPSMHAAALLAFLASTCGAVFDCPASPKYMPTSNGMAAHMERNHLPTSPEYAKNDIALAIERGIG